MTHRTTLEILSLIGQLKDMIGLQRAQMTLLSERVKRLEEKEK